MKRVPHTSCQPATEPSPPALCTANVSALGSIVTPALPFAVHSPSALISPTTHTPATFLFLI